MDSSKEEKIEKSRENGTKYSEEDNKMAASLIKNCEEMEMQLSKLRKNEVILKKKVEMWKRKYMEIEE